LVLTDGAVIVEVCIKRPWPPKVDPRAIDDQVAWSGTVLAVQPRIRLTRSFDERSHSYLGYLLRIEGTVGREASEFRVGVGAGAHAKYQFRIGDQLEGVGHPVLDPRLEIVDLYRVSKLRILRRGEDLTSEAPWHGVPPPLPVYRERGHRRLAAKTYDSNCQSCLWGCAMPVEIIVDHWNPEKRRYRTETFCYGPLSCPDYKSGPTRKVPGRNGMVHEEPDWLDHDTTAHRSLNE
jgi:hypothetical protein